MLSEASAGREEGLVLQELWDMSMRRDPPLTEETVFNGKTKEKAREEIMRDVKKVIDE